jgi:hypothetical protein
LFDWLIDWLIVSVRLAANSCSYKWLNIYLLYPTPHIFLVVVSNICSGFQLALTLLHHFYIILVRKGMHVNEYERLQRYNQLFINKVKEQYFHCCSTFHSYSKVFKNEFSTYIDHRLRLGPIWRLRMITRPIWKCPCINL